LVIATKSKCNNDLHQGLFHINSSNITGHYRTLTSSLFLTILFTQSTAVLHKYLNEELKILCLLQFFPEVAQNSLSFPCSEKSLSILGFPGLWRAPSFIFQAGDESLVEDFSSLAFFPRREATDFSALADIAMRLEETFECISADTGSIWTKRC